MADERKDTAGAANERPEALAQFAESARGQKSKKLTADEHTAPIPTDNREKHKVAETLLNEGAHGKKPDPEEAGVDKLPDRIKESRD